MPRSRRGVDEVRPCASGSKLLFVGNERSSGLSIYDITTFPFDMPTLVKTVAMTNPTQNLAITYEEMFDARTLGPVDPEALKWVEKTDTYGYLFVAGAVSGTLSTFKITCPA